MANLFGQHDADTPPPPVGASARFVRVAVERGIERPEGRGDGPGSRSKRAEASDMWEAGVLTYWCEGTVEIGQRVEVPLGRGNVVSAGIVVEVGGRELAADIPVAKIKPILRQCGTGLPGALVELAKWMAGYYLCPVGMVLSTMMPSAVKRAIGSRAVEMIDWAAPSPPPSGEGAGAEPIIEVKLTPSVRRVWEGLQKLDRHLLPMGAGALAGAIGEKTVRSINRLIEAGLLRRVEVEQVRSRGGAPIGELIEGGWNSEADRDAAAILAGADRDTLENAGKAPLVPQLTAQQGQIVSGISAGLGAFGVHLIRGVTGSGKTEVYLRVIEHLLEKDAASTALVLVPEISLTPQMGGRIQQRLGQFGVAVLHSGLSASQRNKQWQRAALGPDPGGARVVVGARSAIFAPLPNVKLIVVDEEHASDYKQDQLPRYHGRDVAIKRGQVEGCPVVLGSATPSLESWANATEASIPSAHGTSQAGTSASPRSGKYRLWELTERVRGARLPRVEVVDLNNERKLMELRRRAARVGHSSAPHPAVTPAPTGTATHEGKASSLRRMIDLGEMIGPTLEQAMGQTLSAGGQVVLLLNRRGYAGYIACADAMCGWVLRCDDCDAGLVFHKVVDGANLSGKGGRVVRCHHCLAQQLMPSKCPSCNKGLIWLGLGTQRVEEEVAEKFAPIVERAAGCSDAAHSWVVRVDGDTMHSAKDYFDVLGRFARGEVRVLVGTQMIAKGLDFPNVRLVGVINADTALGLADFRATERTFQLVSQVAGRAGRSADKPGRVVVQTMEPDSPAIVHAASHDYVAFAREELDVRRRSALPPITKMARIVIRDEVFERAMKGATQIADELRRAAGNSPLIKGGVRVLGPMECPIVRIAGFYRVGIELSALRRGALQDVLAQVRARGLLKSDSRTAVDVDPIAMV